MIGLDTNVVIRYLVQDDVAQARKANRLIEKSLTPDEPGFINLTTLCEIVWVLKCNYRLDKSGQVAVVDGLLASSIDIFTIRDLHECTRELIRDAEMGDCR